MVAAVVLSDPATGATLALDDGPTGAWFTTAVELGMPAVRAVVSDRPMADGTYDYSRFMGARSVTVNVELAPDPFGAETKQQLLRRLTPFIVPGARPELTFRPEVGDEPRKIRLRADDTSMPWEHPEQLSITLSWQSVDYPMLTSPTVNEASFQWSMAGVEGRRYDLTFDRVYPESGATRGLVRNRGDMPADWEARIAGPLQGPSVYNVTQGQAVVTKPELVVQRGQVLTIRSVDKTVMLGSSSRYHLLDFPATTWWRLRPGDSVVVLLGTGGQSGGSAFADESAAVLRWSDTYLF